MAKQKGVNVAPFRRALEDRITTIVRHFSLAMPIEEFGSLDLHVKISLLARRIYETNDVSLMWLFIIGLTGAFPTQADVLTLRRSLKDSDGYHILSAALEGVVGAASTSPLQNQRIEVVTDAVVVDVDFCARRGHNSGIQRVVRETICRWEGAKDHLLVAWTESGSSLRRLAPNEHDRVVRWTSERRLESSPDVDEVVLPLVVPWNCDVILPEVAQVRFSKRLAALAEFSNNRVSAVAYDAIPVVNAEYVTPDESDRFVKYLSIVKHVDRLFGISESASKEFVGFAEAIGAQGLEGPHISTIALPVDFPKGPESSEPNKAMEPIPEPIVLCVGTQEPRKNQTTVLAAAEKLWDEGHEFSLVFVGGQAVPLSNAFDAAARVLSKRGRSVHVLRHASDEQLAELYRRARFSMFISLHEGFGLPVAESLAYDTPVITTRYGSTAEIAADGGCVMIDPREIGEVVDAMRLLLLDDARLAELTRESASRPSRSWDDYAQELWDAATGVRVS